jgi:hypothetical protein
MIPKVKQVLLCEELNIVICSKEVISNSYLK